MNDTKVFAPRVSHLAPEGAYHMLARRSVRKRGYAGSARSAARLARAVR